MNLARSILTRLNPAPESSRKPETYFFPNQPAHVLSIEMRLRAAVADLPEDKRLELYAIFSHSIDSLSPTTFNREGDMVLALQRDREIAFPSPVPLVKLSHIVFGYEEWLERKYRLPGFVEVEEGDIVVDCGAFVGGFSLSASRIAGQVHAFEPEEHNYRCIKRNLPSIRANLLGLYNETKSMPLNISSSGVEHSLITPDDGPAVGVAQIDVVTLKDYCDANHIERLDFVKIEAEGVELEVFEGLGDVRPRKLAIDVSPERNGESPSAEFQERLAKLGYTTRQRGQVLFARAN